MIFFFHATEPSVVGAIPGELSWSSLSQLVWCISCRCLSDLTVTDHKTNAFTFHGFRPPASLFFDAELFTRATAGWDLLCPHLGVTTLSLLWREEDVRANPSRQLSDQMELPSSLCLFAAQRSGQADTSIWPCALNPSLLLRWIYLPRPSAEETKSFDVSAFFFFPWSPLWKIPLWRITPSG